MNKDMIQPLVDAASAIVKAVREAGETTSQTIGDLRIPIVLGGSDLRIVIESGPRTAAANAVNMAHQKAGGDPRLSRDDAVQLAADIIAVIATELKEAHSRYGVWPAGNEGAKASYDEMLTVVASLKGGAA